MVKTIFLIILFFYSIFTESRKCPNSIINVKNDTIIGKFGEDMKNLCCENNKDCDENYYCGEGNIIKKFNKIYFGKEFGKCIKKSPKYLSNGSKCWSNTECSSSYCNNIKDTNKPGICESNASGNCKDNLASCQDYCCWIGNWVCSKNRLSNCIN